MVEYNLKNIKKDFKAKGIFYTQQELAEFMKSLIDVEISEVYDPTCGNGSLLSVFPKELPKYGQELNKWQLNVAKERLENFKGVCGDTLESPAFMDKKFSCIMANPPFSIKWNPPSGLFIDSRFSVCPYMPPKSKADYAFILHILHLLSNEGIAIVLNFPGILYRGNSEGKIRKWLVENNYIDKVIHVPAKKFVDTTISTCCLVLKKNRATTDIEFFDSEINKSRTVSREEIEENDFTLSVSRYVYEEEVKVEVNPLELQHNARKQMLKKIQADIELDKLVCKIENFDFGEYLCDLDDLIFSYQLEYVKNDNTT